MSIATNSLGSFSFVRINRVGDPDAAPEGLARETAVVERFNVTGSGVILGAVKGRRFQMESFVDVDTINDAHDQAESYRAAIGTGPLELVFQGRNWSSEENTEFVVLDVSGVRVRTITAAAGGLSTSKGAGLWVIWDLIAVPT